MDSPGLQTPLSPQPLTPPEPTPSFPPMPTPPPIQPETPAVAKPKKKFPIKPVAGALVALLLVGGVVFLTRQLVQQRQTAEQQAAGQPGSCAAIGDDRKECIGACSSDGFRCTWNSTQAQCKKGGKRCDETPKTCEDALAVEKIGRAHV